MFVDDELMVMISLREFYLRTRIYTHSYRVLGIVFVIYKLDILWDHSISLVFIWKDFALFETCAFPAIYH